MSNEVPTCAQLIKMMAEMEFQMSKLDQNTK